MTTKLYSCSVNGLKCQIVEVEADVSGGMPSFSIVGLGDTSVQEAKERVRAGIKNSGANFPSTKKIINLAPAELKKQGAFFDLPIALGILAANDQIPIDKIRDAIIVGELSLNGSIRKITGALAITQHAKERGFKRIFLPGENALEASFVEGIEIYTPETLAEMLGHCHGLITLKPHENIDFDRYRSGLRSHEHYSLAKIIGLEDVKRGLSVAAAGGHNVLLSGPPGTGKTVLARAFRELMPEMSREEVMESSKIFSVVGLNQGAYPLVIQRPLREVHHTASVSSIFGGGNIPRPGEITLAHNGVLFFDEITEFPSRVLESLRQPLENKFINIGRGYGSSKFPCDFIFIATMNPCPCGYANDPKIPCICTPGQKSQYLKKLSGPICDRFDIFLNVPNIAMKNIFQETEDNEKILLEKISEATSMQRERFYGRTNFRRNSDMGIEEIKTHCPMHKEAKAFLDYSKRTMNLSSRGYLRAIKVARTIADMDSSPEISNDHMAEALHYKENKISG